MMHKLFIVAADNVGDYRSLQKALASEPNVTIIYDRRRSLSVVPAEERRRRTDVDEQLRTRGWAVVRQRTTDLYTDDGLTRWTPPSNGAPGTLPWRMRAGER
jgi:hypothetical protein